MLKFFRTIRKKLIEQDNVRKYLLYAIGEILLVVVGILIALQVNNWNEQRNDRKYEATMLNEISLALEQNISDMENSVKYLNRLQHSIFELASIKNDPLHSRDSLMYHFNEVRGGGIAVSFNASAYEAIKSSGLDKISDPDLRKNLSLLYEMQLRSVEGWINEIIRETLLKRSEFVRLTFTIDVRADSSQGIRTEYNELEYSWLSTHPDFESFLALSGGYIPRAKSNVEYAITAMTEVNDQIKSYLDE
jgi:hypothetical protein